MAAHSPAKILRRWTARRATWRATSPRTLLPRVWPRAEVQLAYAIGVAEPVSVMVDTFGTATIPEEKITAAGSREFLADAQGHHRDARPSQPVYKATAAYGHFGRTGPGFTWERTDRADALRKAAGSAAVAEVAARR